ncbi:DUF4114 domain-containing protein [Fischerella thermalis]|uniref:DUF4114 domain-containing protein n=1 Tax=Fischerella thermalis TaxID=372787 RepID=UPI000C8105C9|nr:DUF4114 domain-containing protein [Fischerella thermalis]MBF2070076.1 DUF4114 domain-containing protein [Fischerella thermalis M48_A2018_028]PLZ92162.1 PEP-CTERM sorting domain-containing protein [Fischerella thermalis CCMEE 5194]
MIKKGLTRIIVAAATLTGLFSQVGSASASDFTWDDSWVQPAIQSKETTGFDDTFFQQFVQPERMAIPNSQQFLLDPSKLFLKYSNDVSVFFINEGAGYRNQLAYQATGATNKSGVVFNDIACSGPGCVGDWGGNTLKLGDGVNLGYFAAGTQLDFWLRADGLNRGASANIFGTKTSSNLDGLQHVIAYAIGDYILLGFEDLYGDLGASGIDPKTGKYNEHSDRDFNDVVMVLKIGEKNVKALTSTSVPEPSVTLSLLGVGALGMLKLRRQKQIKEST